MNLLAKMTAAALFAASPATARAVDLITVPTSGNDQLPVADAGFDWNGFYAGVYGVTQALPAGGVQYGLGLDVGANARLEFVLVGAEVNYQGLVGGGGGTGYLEGVGKVGVALSDDLVLYGAGGAGIDPGAAETDALLGAGLELAVADNVTLGARYLHGIPITGANPKDQVTVGANFHF